MPKQMEYTINSTRYGVRVLTGRYNTAALWALWGEDDVLVVNSMAGILIPATQIIGWLDQPGDGSKPS